MMTLKFADTHNMVAFLSKPTESDGFEQIVDFLNAHSIRHALTINPTIYISCIEQFWSTVKAKTINGEVQLHALVDGKKIVVTEASVRKDIQLADEEDKAVNKELGDSLVRTATTASSLEAEHDSGNITKTQSKETPNESSSLGTTSGGGPKGNTLRSDEDRLKLNELMELCTTLQKKVLDLEKTKTTQANKITKSSGDEEDLGEDASKQGRRINAIDADKDITLVNVQDDVDNEMFDVNVLNGEEVFVARQNENVVEEAIDAAQVSTAATTVTITTEEITLAQALEALKTSKPKLQAEFDKEERLTREKARKEKEANIALIEEWDNIQAKIDADHQLAERLQAQEQEELSDAEKATLFQQLLEKRRKHFVAKRAEEKRNKPPTKAQQKKIMCTYLKNMEGYKLNDLKLKDFDSIQEMFDIAFKRVNTFKDFRTELVEGKENRVGEELIQESLKKQKDKEEVTIDAIPLAVKSPRMQSMQIYMLIEKKYPLTPPIVSMMLEKKLQIDYESKMAYQLCKLIKK
ncbi:hypothetical protein Tco_0678373 [Tanacetum coccineum]|uniref:Xylulose kinase-1 n=1 Tax=Tanacetum coccineum TaxID=301880 RepID=A0ABQ4XF17_9ASTR